MEENWVFFIFTTFSLLDFFTITVAFAAESEVNMTVYMQHFYWEAEIKKSMMETYYSKVFLSRLFTAQAMPF